MNDLSLLQLIYTRISHDLSGTVGAIYNGTELLVEDTSFCQETSALIQTSAVDLMARLKFFRQTFGLQNKESPDTTADYLKTFSMPFSLTAPCENALQRAVMMMITDLFYKGAVITLQTDYIEATGQALKESPLLKDVLEKGTPTQTAAEAPALFAYYAAKEKGKKLTFTSFEKKIRIEIKDNNENGSHRF